MFFMGALMLPGQLTMITNYSTIIKLNLINKLTGVILLGIFSAFAIFMMRQFIAGLPREVDDAAKMDGCGFWGNLSPHRPAAVHADRFGQSHSVFQRGVGGLFHADADFTET